MADLFACDTCHNCIVLYNFASFCADKLLFIMVNSQIHHFYCATFSFKTTPLPVRERLQNRLTARWEGVQTDFESGEKNGLGPITEMALLMTCGRIELIVTIPQEKEAGFQAFRSLLEVWTGERWEAIAPLMRWTQGWDAVHHLAEVAAGLDSQVLGEPQILGQVSRAADQMVPAKNTQGFMAAILKRVIQIGKRVRSETKISHRSVSMSAIAVSTMAASFPDRQKTRVLVIGLGEMGHLAVKALRAQGFQQVILLNRTLKVAESLGEAFGFAAQPLDQLPLLLDKVDAVFCATAAPEPLITVEMLDQNVGNNPQLFIDLAVPPDVEPGVADLPGVSLIDVDHLRTDLDQSLASRQAEIPHARAIIDEIQPLVEDDLRQLEIRPLIVNLRQQVEEIRQREVARTIRYLGDDVDDRVTEQLEHLSRALVNKLFHQPTRQLRQLPPEKTADYAAAMQELFGLR